MKQNTLIVIVAMGAAITTGLWLLHNIDFASATSELIDTSTGEIARSGTAGETAPAGTLAGVTLRS